MHFERPHTIRAPIRCFSYRAGHRTHWIQWNQSRRVSAAWSDVWVVDVEDSGWFVAEIYDGEPERWWHHDPARLRQLVATYGRHVEVCVALHVIWVDSYFVNYSATLDTACVHEPAMWA